MLVVMGEEMAKTKNINLRELEDKLYHFLKKDFEQHPPKDRTRFSEQELIKALNVDLESFRKAIKKLWMRNGHIFQYVEKGVWKYRYRSKTRQEVEDTGDIIVEGRLGLKLGAAKKMRRRGGREK